MPSDVEALSAACNKDVSGNGCQPGEASRIAGEAGQDEEVQNTLATGADLVQEEGRFGGGDS